MRDIDTSEAGHNMMFLTNILNNMLSIFNADQKAMFLALAREQEGIYRQIAEKRLVLIKAFRANIEGTIPAGYKALSETAVKNYVAGIFDLDGTLSYRRAEVYGAIAKSLTATQIAAIKKLAFNDSSTWKEMPDQTDKKSMTHEQDVLYSTYVSEFFSWYAGSIEADVYFCPERHGTYFGGFYMKDYPAIGHSDYFIPIDLTSDAGVNMLALLTDSQRAQITGIKEPLQVMLTEILAIRRTIATEFRKFLAGTTANKALVMQLSHRYGELDGALSYLYATRFAAVYKTLTQTQKDALVKLRNQNVFPEGVYLYADPVKTPAEPDTSILFSK
ncbi:MAG: hypothetical protein EHM28_05110 [Spirochaetaceae bacterium]|nr:MAG: hypothetical protein EHM28_05110 [Spirochaetaceae bacterium]